MTIAQLDPTSYFKNIFNLLLKTEVTNEHNAPVSMDDAVKQALDLILVPEKKIIVIGNGGSAAIASHVHNDLCHAVGVRAMVFTEPSQLTSLSNDHGYEEVFERPMELWAGPGDVVIAISSSGQSMNIIRAVKAALKHDCKVITFSGFQKTNPLRKLGCLNFYVGSSRYGDVEVSHMSLMHFLTDSAMLVRQKVGALF